MHCSLRPATLVPHQPPVPAQGKPKPKELPNPLPPATQMYVKMALHTAVHNTRWGAPERCRAVLGHETHSLAAGAVASNHAGARPCSCCLLCIICRRPLAAPSLLSLPAPLCVCSKKFHLPEVDVEAAEAALAEANIEAVLEEDSDEEGEGEAGGAGSSSQGGQCQEGTVPTPDPLLPGGLGPVRCPSSSARSQEGSQGGCVSAGSTPTCSSGASTPRVLQGEAAAPAGPEQLVTTAADRLKALAVDIPASGAARSRSRTPDSGRSGSPGGQQVGSACSSGSRRSSMDKEGRPCIRAVAANWRAWVAVRDSPCPGARGVRLVPLELAAFFGALPAALPCFRILSATLPAPLNPLRAGSEFLCCPPYSCLQATPCGTARSRCGRGRNAACAVCMHALPGPAFCGRAEAVNRWREAVLWSALLPAHQLPWLTSFPAQPNAQQIVYHYTRDRAVLAKALLRRGCVPHSTAPLPATGLLDPAYQAYHSAAMEAQKMAGVRRHYPPAPASGEPISAA